MKKDFWVNLPVKDLHRSKLFFTKMGFQFSEGPGNTPTSAPLLVGNKDVVVMLFEEPVFKGFVNQELTDTRKTCEVLLSFSVDSKEEVDEIAGRVLDAGGSTEHVPRDMEGPFYSCVFCDPDGHKWNILYVRDE